jgi:aryl-alcohol dehydrogenase-like predicted oxidoreductase
MSPAITAKKRRIGSQGLQASLIGLGCMGMSEFYGPSNEKESIATIHRAMELGVDMLDTADMYGPFKNEELVGRAIKGKRDRVIIATKFGNVRDPRDPTKRSINGRPEYVKQACEGSLKRLGVETIDLYYQHRVDPNTPIEDTVGAMADLVAEGKVRYLGLSEAAVNTIRRAHKVHPISAVQTEYSLWTRDPEEGLLDALRTLGIGFVAYSPLGRGFLTGQIKRVEDLAEDDFRRQNPRFQGDNFQKNLELVGKVEEIAKEHKCTPAQLAVAWVLAQGDDIVPIPGTRHPERVEENVGALNVVLSENDLRRIDAAAPKGAAAGARYAEGGMKAVNI